LLEHYGWTPEWAETFAPFAAQELVPGRVAVEHRGAYLVRVEAEEVEAEVAAKLRRDAEAAADFPAVGDWVALELRAGERALIHAVLPRRTKFSRTSATTNNRMEEQIVAANVDVVFLVSGLDGDFNVRRLERYLTLGYKSGAQPVIVLTKADVCDDVEEQVAEAEVVAFGVPVHAVSNLTGEGIDELRPYFDGNRTVAALGSSGVGKSTLVNTLAGEQLMEIGDLRADGKGRHTTRTRELLPMPGGGLFLDTPGMRELRLWDADEGLEAAFADVVELEAQCRFNDCGHEVEPGCAIRAALASGELDADRFESYRKLQRELARLERLQDKRAGAEFRKQWRRMAKSRRKAVW
jgi:ribosome biogenesis GTPase